MCLLLGAWLTASCQRWRRPPPTLLCLSCCCSAAGLLLLFIPSRRRTLRLRRVVWPHRLNCVHTGDVDDISMPSTPRRAWETFPFFHNEQKKKEIGSLTPPTQLNLTFLLLFRPGHDVFFSKKKIKKLRNYFNVFFFGTWNVYHGWCEYDVFHYITSYTLEGNVIVVWGFFFCFFYIKQTET